MARKCPILQHAAAISDAIAYSGSQMPSGEVSVRAAESHNYGNCMESDCVWTVDGDCAFVKSVSKQSGLIKALDYLNIAVRDLVNMIRVKF